MKEVGRGGEAKSRLVNCRSRTSDTNARRKRRKRRRTRRRKKRTRTTRRKRRIFGKKPELNELKRKAFSSVSILGPTAPFFSALEVCSASPWGEEEQEEEEEGPRSREAEEEEENYSMAVRLRYRLLKGAIQYEEDCEEVRT